MSVSDESPGLRVSLEVRAQGLLATCDDVYERRVGERSGDDVPGPCVQHVLGDRELRAREASFAHGAQVATIVGGEGGDGTDRLDVAGDADIGFHSRTVMMSGTLRRHYIGGFIKASSMEGVMCGGAFMRVVAGPALTMSAISTSDIYGGAARVAAVRSMFAGMHYRSTVAAAWASLLYVRSATFLIEPLVTVHTEGPRGNAAAKMARLAKVLGAARMVCPLLDIACGVGALAVGVGSGLYALASRAVKGRPPPQPLVATPRVHVRNYGMCSESVASILHL